MIFRKLVAVILAAPSFTATASTLSGQDFPFFICSASHLALGTFSLGPTPKSETGYALWAADKDGWEMSSIAFNRDDSGFAASGSIIGTYEPFNVRIPFSCAQQCRGTIAVGTNGFTPIAIKCARFVPDRTFED